jgi:hypothetical protein
MSAHFERIVVFLVMSFLVLLFSWIYMRDRQQRVGLWMIGWISIFVHFTATLFASFSVISSGLADWLAVVTLEIAGMSQGLRLAETERHFSGIDRRPFTHLHHIVVSSNPPHMDVPKHCGPGLGHGIGAAHFLL